MLIKGARKTNELLIMAGMIAALLILALFFGNLLQVSPSFLYGVLAGILGAGLIVGAKRYIDLKNSNNPNDERIVYIRYASGFMAFFITIMSAAVFSFIAASQNITLSIKPTELGAILIVYMLLCYFGSYLIYSRKY